MESFSNDRAEKITNGQIDNSDIPNNNAIGTSSNAKQQLLKQSAGENLGQKAEKIREFFNGHYTLNKMQKNKCKLPSLVNHNRTDAVI